MRILQLPLALPVLEAGDCVADVISAAHADDNVGRQSNLSRDGLWELVLDVDAHGAHSFHGHRIDLRRRPRASREHQHVIPSQVSRPRRRHLRPACVVPAQEQHSGFLELDALAGLEDGREAVGAELGSTSLVVQACFVCCLLVSSRGQGKELHGQGVLVGVRLVANSPSMITHRYCREERRSP